MMSHSDDDPSSRTGTGWSRVTTSRPRQAFAAALMAPFLLFAGLFVGTQVTPLSRFLAQSSPPLPKWAVVNFVDESDEYLWGLYSTHTQLRKLGMTPTVAHIAMVSSAMSKKSKALVTEWLGPQQVVEFDRDALLDKVNRGLRQGVFLKLLAYNMTDFEKLIVIDNDVFIRKNIMHWYDYPAPAATGARGMIEWNSGAMVIEPSTKMFNLLMEYLPKVRRWTTRDRMKEDWEPDEDDEEDTWTSNGGQQGFLSAVYLSNVTNESIYTMSYGHSVLTSDLEDRPGNEYYWKYRPHVFQTVHFTRHKPWKPNIASSSPVVCGMMREWAASVKDAPKDRLPKFTNDFMRKCPPPKDFELERLKAST